MWTTARLTGYIVIGLSAGAMVLKALGLAEYDQATGMIDPAPFSIYTVAPIIAAPIAALIAALAVVFKWGPAKQ